MLQGLLMFLLFVTALFLILVVLVQRGRGGGLAGAFGGMGGQSAFGTKAGDLFTRITIVVAAFWIILCAVSVKLLATDNNQLVRELGTSGSTSVPATGKSDTGKSATGTSSTPSKSFPPGRAESPAKSPSGSSPKAKK